MLSIHKTKENFYNPPETLCTGTWPYETNRLWPFQSHVPSIKTDIISMADMEAVDLRCSHAHPIHLQNEHAVCSLHLMSVFALDLDGSCRLLVAPIHPPGAVGLQLAVVTVEWRIVALKRMPKAGEAERVVKVVDMLGTTDLVVARQVGLLVSEVTRGTVLVCSFAALVVAVAEEEDMALLGKCCCVLADVLGFCGEEDRFLHELGDLAVVEAQDMVSTLDCLMDMVCWHVSQTVLVHLQDMVCFLSAKVMHVYLELATNSKVL
jgi:hypothetical protein